MFTRFKDDAVITSTHFTPLFGESGIITVIYPFFLSVHRFLCKLGIHTAPLAQVVVYTNKINYEAVKGISKPL
jgi:uncharacterized membrane protein YozB (DUF420 family)